MKNLGTLFLTLASSVATFAQTTWTVDKSHAKVQFNVSHMMLSETSGHFKKFDGTISSTTETDFANASVDFTIDANSIDTDDEKRDGHLKSADFFDVAKYPTITFKSKTFKKLKDKIYKVEGDLTMHGVTKKVSFDVTYAGTANDSWGNTKTAFKFNTVLLRSDYKISEATPAAMVGNEIDVRINLEFTKKK